MKDNRGSTLEVGDTVIYNRNTYYTEPQVGYVVGFTPKRVKIGATKDTESRLGMVKRPLDVIKVILP